MKRLIALVIAGFFLTVMAGASEARGQGGGGRGGGGHGGGGHGAGPVYRGGGGGHGAGPVYRGGHFQGHRHWGGHGHWHGHGFRSTVIVGGGWWGPYWDPYWYPAYYPYGYSYPYAPYAAAPVTTEPQTYIEQPGAASYWYYCEGAKAYYPYVRECPGGWLTVLPQAAPEPSQ